MSNYGQQPPYGQQPGGQPPNPYPQPQPQPPYGAPQQPYGQPAAQPSANRPAPPPYGAPQQPYGQPAPPYPPPQQQPYGAPPQQGQWTPQPPAVKKPALVHRSIAVVTMDAVPGREIDSVIGEVVGVIARTRELRPDLRAGNPIEGYATMLSDSRQDAVSKMVEMATDAGADAVLGLRFDCSEITQSLSEVAAYGTAVKLVPTEEPAPADAAEEASDQPADAGAAQQWPPSSWPQS